MLRTYQQTDLFSEFLQYENFSELFLSRIQSDSLFCKIYNKTKLITDISYAEFGKLTIEYAVILQSAMEILPGQLVAVKAENNIETMAIYTATLLCGATIIPVNPNETEDYTQKILMDSKVDMYIEDHDEFHSNISEFKDVDFQYVKTDLTHKAAIFFTSGTTGNSKGVVLSLGNLLINSIATQKAHALEQSSIHFSCLPICHVNAFSFTYFTNFMIGSSFIYQQVFFPINYWKLIKDHKIEIVSATPHIINLLNQDKREFKQEDFPHLKYFVSASAPLSTGDVKTFRNKFGIRINQAYGLSETVNFSLTIPKDLSEETYIKAMEKQSIPSAGVPIFGNTVDIYSNKSKKILSEGEIGELVIRGWNVFQAYLYNEEETKKATSENFFHSGDLGFYKIIEGEKFVFICGRLKEVVKRKGLLCHLSEIDLDLRDYFKNISFCSCGFNNTITGEEIGLIVEDLSQINEKCLEEFLLSKFPAHKRPKVIIEAKILRTATLKPKRNAMKFYFTEYSQSRILDKDTLFLYKKNDLGPRNE